MRPSTRKKLRKVLFIVCGLLLLVFLYLLSMSLGAAAIFNRAMEQQTLLRGTVTAGEIIAHVNGFVVFRDLVWKDPRGRTILSIPSGSFDVRLWDIITGNLRASTIQELTLEDAAVSIHLGPNMQVDFVQNSEDLKKIKLLHGAPDEEAMKSVSLVGKTPEEQKAIAEYKRRRKAGEFVKNWQNFNLQEHHIQTKLHFKNCLFEVMYRGRHYLLNGCDLRSYLNLDNDPSTDDELTLSVSTSNFGGDMIGRGVSLNGAIDFTSVPEPTCDFNLIFFNVIPYSLGFGMDVRNPMTLLVNLTGPITNPIGKGKVQMENLDFPGLSFSNVEGQLYYRDSHFYFSNVNANLFKGQLEAHGDYDLDTRCYNIYGHGEGLQASAALPGESLDCPVTVDITVNSKGSAKNTVYFGSFCSGPGTYHFVPFQRISGKYNVLFHDMNFYDVLIEFRGMKVSTAYLRSNNGKLTLDPVYLYDADGSILYTYEMPPQE